MRPTRPSASSPIESLCPSKLVRYRADGRIRRRLNWLIARHVRRWLPVESPRPRVRRTQASTRRREKGDKRPSSASGVARMARLGVRSGSLAFARQTRNLGNKRFERTGANGCDHRAHLPCRRSWVRVPSSALEKPRSPVAGVFCCLRVERRDWKWLASAFLCLNMEPRRVSASVAFAYLCPNEGAVVGFPVRGAEAAAAFGGPRVNLVGFANSGGLVFVDESAQQVAAA
jgi:hypothetical protein